MPARAPEEPGFGRGFFLSILLHAAMAACIWGVAEATRPPELPRGILSVRLTPLSGGGGPAGTRESGPAPARPNPSPPRDRPTRVPEPPKPKPKPKPKPPEPETPEPNETKPETPEPEKQSPEPRKPAPKKLVTAETPAEKSAPTPVSPKPAPSSTQGPPTPAPSTDTTATPGPGGGGATAGSGGGQGPGTGPGTGGIVLDSPFPFAWYLEIIQRRVSRNWLKPAAAAGLEEGTVIYFRVLRDGRLGIVEVERSSGLALFDRSALRAVHAMGQLPPLPTGFGEEYLGVHFEFLP